MESTTECTEPDGNEVAITVFGISGGKETSKHDAMIAATGHCPWCGRDERIVRSALSELAAS
jgi:hypothetical protein